MIGSTLTLFKTRILFVDHIQSTFPANNFAVDASLFNGGLYLHNLALLLIDISA